MANIEMDVMINPADHRGSFRGSHQSDGPHPPRGAPSKPRSARDAAKEDLKPKLSCMPDLCADTREKAYKWYPGPEICAHRMHWTEWIYVIFSIIALLMFIFEGKVPVSVVGILIMTVSSISLLMFWGYAQYKSLADVASKLEKMAVENHGEVCALTMINDGWEEGLVKNQANQDQFAVSMGLVSDDANAISELTDCLTGLVDAKRDLQNEEKELFQTTIKIEEVTRQEAREKEITVLKQRFMRFFDRIDRKNRGGGGGNDGKLSGGEIDEIKVMLRKDTFLNSVDEEGVRMFPWEEPFAAAHAEDGKISKYEILSVLEIATNAFFNKIKDACKDEETLTDQLQQLQRGL